MKDLKAMRTSIQELAALEAWETLGRQMTEQDCRNIAIDMLSTLIVEKTMTLEEAREIKTNLYFHLDVPDISDVSWGDIKILKR